MKDKLRIEYSGGEYIVKDTKTGKSYTGFDNRQEAEEFIEMQNDKGSGVAFENSQIKVDDIVKVRLAINEGSHGPHKTYHDSPAIVRSLMPNGIVEVKIQSTGKVMKVPASAIQNSAAFQNGRIKALNAISKMKNASAEKKIEAYGVKGMKSTPWRKVFKNQQEFEKFLDANEGNIEVYGTRDL